MKSIALVYMAAGISSRLGGKIQQFANIGPNNETLIELSLEEAIPAGFSKIIFIVGDKTEKLFKEKFGNELNGIPVLYALQTYDKKKRDKPWGTTDALCAIKKIIKEPFVICNSDNLYGKTAFKILVEHLKNKEGEATLGYKLINTLEKRKANRAIFKFDKENYVRELKEIFDVEKNNLSASGTKPNDLVSMNIFALHPEVIELLEEKLRKFKEKHEENRKIECLLPDELGRLIKEGKIKMKLYPVPDKILEISYPEDEERARKELSKI